MTDYEKKRDNAESKHFSSQMRFGRKIEDTYYCKGDFIAGSEFGYKLGQESAKELVESLTEALEMCIDYGDLGTIMKNGKIFDLSQHAQNLLAKAKGG